MGPSGRACAAAPIVASAAPSIATQRGVRPCAKRPASGRTTMATAAVVANAIPTSMADASMRRVTSDGMAAISTPNEANVHHTAIVTPANVRTQPGPVTEVVELVAWSCGCVVMGDGRRPFDRSLPLNII